MERGDGLGDGWITWGDGYEGEGGIEMSRKGASEDTSWILKTWGRKETQPDFP